MQSKTHDMTEQRLARLADDGVAGCITVDVVILPSPFRSTHCPSSFRPMCTREPRPLAVSSRLPVHTPPLASTVDREGFLQGREGVHARLPTNAWGHAHRITARYNAVQLRATREASAAAKRTCTARRARCSTPPGWPRCPCGPGPPCLAPRWAPTAAGTASP